MPELKLPERLRDVDMMGSVSDASKSVSDALSDRWSKMDLPRVDFSKVEMPKVDMPKVDVKVSDLRGMKLPKMKDVVPQRSGPSPLPFLLFGMIGGLCIGLWAATSDVFGPQIRSTISDLEDRIQSMLPGAGAKADQIASTFERTVSDATNRAQDDYARTADSLGTSLGDQPIGVGASSDGSTAAESYATAVDMGSGVDSSPGTEPHGTSGSSY